MDIKTNDHRPLPDVTLTATDIKRIDRLVGPELRAKFIRDAVKHSLLLEEYVKTHRRKARAASRT